MSRFRICVQADITKEWTITETWFDLPNSAPDSVRRALEKSGADPQTAKIVATNGFYGYEPKTIDEACSLYADYQKLDDPQSWLLYLSWYSDPSINLPKTVPNFEKTFLGLYESPGEYMKEEALENNEIRINSAVLPYVNWEAYADREHIAGKIDFCRVPLSRKTAVFETRL